MFLVEAWILMVKPIRRGVGIDNRRGTLIIFVEFCYQRLERQENTLLPGSSTSALFGYLNNLVNKKLIFGSKWKTDIHVTLSAFELMSAMAETRIHNISKSPLMAFSFLVKNTCI